MYVILKKRFLAPDEEYEVCSELKPLIDDSWYYEEGWEKVWARVDIITNQE
jgi:hypothetical protein